MLRQTGSKSKTFIASLGLLMRCSGSSGAQISGSGDFVDGVGDVRARRLKLIGDPETRYREDPVRMLRAVRFAAKLDFSIEASTEEPIRKLAYLLDGVPPARLFDECLKLFLSGFGAKSFRLLQQYRLFEHLFPMSAAAMKLPPYA